jgi:hypothetical protein
MVGDERGMGEACHHAAPLGETVIEIGPRRSSSRRVRGDRCEGDSCIFSLSPDYSYLSATIGSTFIARRAGM